MAKERRVEVLWMDYARKWAHELDLRRGSWITKRRTDQKDLPAEAKIEFYKPSSKAQAEAWKELALQQNNHYQLKSTIFRDTYKKKLLTPEQAREKEENIKAIAFWQAVIRCLNEYIKRQNVEESASSSYAIINEHRLALAQLLGLLEKYAQPADFEASDALLYYSLIDQYANLDQAREDGQ